MSDSFALDRLAAFPKARQGYARGPVDAYVLNVQRAVETLRQDNEALNRQLQRLSEQANEAESKYERIRTADLDERAQDILTAAEVRASSIVAEGERAAADLIRRAHREAEVAMERSRQELAWARRQLAAERAALARQQQAPPAQPAEPTKPAEEAPPTPSSTGQPS